MSTHWFSRSEIMWNENENIDCVRKKWSSYSSTLLVNLSEESLNTSLMVLLLKYNLTRYDSIRRNYSLKLLSTSTTHRQAWHCRRCRRWRRDAAASPSFSCPCTYWRRSESRSGDDGTGWRRHRTDRSTSTRSKIRFTGSDNDDNTLYVCLSMCLRVRACLWCVCACICMCVICVCACMREHACVRTCVRVYTCVCVHM